MDELDQMIEYYQRAEQDRLEALRQLRVAQHRIKELEALEATCPRCGMEQVKVG